MTFRRWVLLVGVAAATACSSAKSSTPTDSGTTDGSADGIPGVTGLVAGNGVAIPDPPLKDPCAALGIAATSCAPGDACPPLTCDCPDGPQMLQVFDPCTFTHQCLAGVSCPAVCAAGMGVSDQLFICLFTGSCKTDADCTDPTRPHCLLAPADTTGQCTSMQTGACNRDADCEAVCVASNGGPRSCQDRKSGSPCNRNNHCEPGAVAGVGACILPDGQYAGACSDGTNGAPCFTNDQCIPGYSCIRLQQDSFGMCSSRNKSAPCVADADCFQGRCVGFAGTWGKCDSGEMGAPCEEPADCLVPSCFEQKCTGGGNGVTCFQDAQCATKKCTLNTEPGGGLGQCTDGKAGSACGGQNINNCEAGLHCSTASSGTCIAPVGVGATCSRDVDCQSQKCGGIPNFPVGQCTEGKRGQRCRESAQCEPGLHCVFYGGGGVCVSGAAGDPCLLAADCESGVCPTPGGTAPTFCYGFADFQSCASQRVCVAGACLPACQ